METFYLIFTDLDGTLLDHDTYGYGEAREALDYIKRRRIPLILCSSKTRAEDASKGLMKMTVDIAASLFRMLASEGVIFSEGLFNTLRAAYIREAIKRYNDDAAINSLKFERHTEASAVEAFADSIKIAGDQILRDPLGVPLIPSWGRVLSAIPEIFDMLIEAVDRDNQVS